MGKGNNRREDENPERFKYYKAIYNAYSLGQINEWKGMPDMQKKSRPKQTVYQKGDVDGALFTVDEDKFQEEVKKPFDAAWDDIKNKRWNNKVQDAIQSFEDLSAGGGGGRGPSFMAME
jgi:hypothetical protein